MVTIGDVYAFSLLKKAGELGISIPGDMSVIGFDDREACRYSNPPLTSINQPMEEMGRTACRFLFERLEAPKRPAKKTTLDVELVVRTSTGPFRSEEQMHKEEIKMV